MISPLQSAVWILTTFVSLIVPQSPTIKLIYQVAIVISLCAHSRSRAPLLQLLAFSAPTIVGLLIIHGIASSAYPVTSYIANTVPLRNQGFVHGWETAINLIAMFLIAVQLRQVDRQRLFNWLIACGCPTFLLIMFAQSIVVLKTLHRRANTILMAQQARGVRTGPGVFYRISALPSLVIPSTVPLITDADSRAAALASRGLGVQHISSRTNGLLTKQEAVEAGVWILCWAASYAISK